RRRGRPSMSGKTPVGNHERCALVTTKGTKDTKNRPHPARRDGEQDGQLDPTSDDEIDPIRFTRMVKQIRTSAMPPSAHGDRAAAMPRYQLQRSHTILSTNPHKADGVRGLKRACCSHAVFSTNPHK